MNTNNAYATDIALNMESAVQHMQPTLVQAHRKPLPSTLPEITSYIECLMFSEEECLLTEQEKEICDRATD